MAFFVDRAGKLTNKRRTATGGFLVDATLARTGVLDYNVGGKRVRRYNPPEVLQSTLDQLATVPVTMRHPPKMVDTSNYNGLALGHVAGASKFEDGYIKATLAIQDADLIDAIESGELEEVSMGYYADHDTTPGVAGNESYDEARIAISWNHVAIVEKGRAGKAVRLALDSADIPQEDEATVLKLKIKGQEVDADKAQAQIDALEAEVVVLKTQADAATAEAKTAKDALAEKTSPEAISKAVSDKIAADKVIQDAADARAAKVALVEKHFPGQVQKDSSEAFIDGLHVAASAMDAKAKEAKAKDPEGLDALKGTAKDNEEATDAEPVLRGRDKMLAENKKLSQKGLKASE